MSKTGKRISLFLLIVSLIMILSTTGCGGKSESSSDADTAAEKSASNEPKYGGVLRIATGRDPLTIGYPAKIMWGGTVPRVHAVLESLFRVNEKGEIVPHLAKEYSTSTDGQTVTIKLNEGIKFHDGTVLDAEAVMWNIQQFRDAKAGSAKKITEMKAVDTYTLEISLDSPDFLLIPNLALNNISLMVSPTACKENGVEWAEKNPIGTGPFKLESWQPDVLAVYVKNEDYWKAGRPYLDKIEMHTIKDDSVAAAAMQNGDIDMIYDLTPISFETLKAAGDYEMIVSSIGSGVYGLMPDSNYEGPLADVKVRQAIWSAVDFKTIVETTMSESFKVTNQLAIEGSWAFNDDVQGYPYDVDKAKALLAEAGYADGFTTNLYLQNSDLNRDLGPAIQAYLKDVGITINIDMMDNARYEDMLIRTGWKDGLALVPLGINPTPLNPLNSMLFKGMHQKKLPALGVPEEIEQLCHDASYALSEQGMVAKVQEFQKAATDKYAMVIWIYGTLGAAAKQIYVVGDEMAKLHSYQWLPEEAWLNK